MKGVDIKMGKLRAVYYINQFYAGIGGEEMADVGLSVYDEKKGPAMGIEPMWKGEMESCLRSRMYLWQGRRLMQDVMVSLVPKCAIM